MREPPHWIRRWPFWSSIARLASQGCVPASAPFTILSSPSLFPASRLCRVGLDALMLARAWSSIQLETKVREVYTITFNQENALVGALFVIVKLITSRRFVSSSIPQTPWPVWPRSSCPPARPGWRDPPRSCTCTPSSSCHDAASGADLCGDLNMATPQPPRNTSLNVRNAISQFLKEILSSGLRALGARSEC